MTLALAVMMIALMLPVAAGAEPSVLLGVQSDSQGGSSEVGGDFLISSAIDNQEYPAVAYGLDDDRYLVVWHDTRNFDESGYDIYGQIYSIEGEPLGGNFAISIAEGDQRRPAVAYSTRAHEYLVVWEDNRDGLDDIYGQRLDSEGILLDNDSTPGQGESDPTINFAISTADSVQCNPAVAYNSATDDYLVVWQDNRRDWNDRDIHGQVVDADGILLYGDITVSSAEGKQWAPQVAYNVAADEHVVVWYIEQSAQLSVYGQRLEPDGVLLDNDGTPTEDESEPDINFPIALHPDGASWPSIACTVEEGECLVVFTISIDSSSNYGQRLGIDGDLLDNLGTAEQDESDPGISFLIVDMQGAQLPEVAFNEHDHQYLVVWTDARHYWDTDYDLIGQRISVGGDLAEQGNFTISTATGRQDYPVVAYSTESRQYLVVWVDWRTETAKHIYGQRVWFPGLLLGHNFLISSELVTHKAPAVAYNSRLQQYLVVWADERNGNADIYSQLYDHEGNPLEDNFAIFLSSGAAIHPSVVYDEDLREYLIVWGWGGDACSIAGKWIHEHGTSATTANSLYYDSGLCRDPVVVYNGDHEYLVAFTHESNGDSVIRGVLIDDEGNSLRDDIIFDDNPGDQVDLAAVYNPTSGQYLVVWQDKENDQGDIHGRRLDAAYQLHPEFIIAQDTDLQAAPAVAWNELTNEYLVVWHDYRGSSTTGSDIYGQLLSGNGDLLGGNFAVSTSANLDFQQNPDIAYVQALDRYRVVWQDNRQAALGWDLRGQWVSAGGDVLGVFDTPVFRFPADQRYPALAYGHDYVQALTVWQDGRTGADNIYGRLGILDTEPPSAEFAAYGQWGQVGDLFIFSAQLSSDNRTPTGALLARWHSTSARSQKFLGYNT